MVAVVEAVAVVMVAVMGVTVALATGLGLYTGVAKVEVVRGVCTLVASPALR